jgi:hypothetical protein
MATITIVERKGSGDFSRGPGASEGKILFAVFGAASQGEALLAAEGDDRAPPILSGFLRGKGSVTEVGPALDFVDFDYERSIANETTDPSSGQSPADAKPKPEGGRPNEEEVSRDVTFSTGGGTRMRKFSLGTLKYCKDGDTAPDFGGLMNYNPQTKECTGVQVFTGGCDFTISKRFRVITLGWLREMMGKIACTNDSPFLNMAIGEVLFKGSDGHYSDGDPKPWNITGRFGYSPDLTLEDNPEDCTFGDAEDPTAVTVPLLPGWAYVWTLDMQTTEKITINGNLVDFGVKLPRFVYVETVYQDADLNQLGFD